MQQLSQGCWITMKVQKHAEIYEHIKKACRYATQMRNLRARVGKHKTHQLSPFGNTDVRNRRFVICTNETREDDDEDANLKASHLLLLPTTPLQQL